MAKFYGVIGFEEQIEAKPSTYLPSVSERRYSGSIERNYRRTEAGEGSNDDVTLNNELSILADPYALNHFNSIRYIKWHGGCWKVTGIDASTYPRLKLTIGGVYNGPTLAS